MPDAILTNVPGMKDACAGSPSGRHATFAESDFIAIMSRTASRCLIKGAVRHWPASRNWRDPAYLKKLCGHYQMLFFPHENHVTFKRMLARQRGHALCPALDG